eukprot:3582129-Amphidinium_carterae.1
MGRGSSGIVVQFKVEPSGTSARPWTGGDVRPPKHFEAEKPKQVEVLGSQLALPFSIAADL